jgi:hypothetical protein
MNMQITEVKIRPVNDDLVKGYVDIVFDNCFMVEEIRRGPLKAPRGSSSHFLPNHKETAHTGSLRIRPMLKRE